VTKVVVFAPLHTSLYSRLIANALLKMEGIELCGIVVRNHLNWARFKSEFTRDGARLLNKIRQKYILGDERFTDKANQNLGALAEKQQLQYASLKEIVVQNHIPYLVVNDLNDFKSESFIKQLSPDLIAFTGGGLVRDNILSIPKIGVLNCHTGILPQYRGMDVVEWTAAEGNIEKVGFGATLHLMDKGVDSGPIVLKRTIDLLPHDRFGSIREHLEVVMVELMIEGIAILKDRALQPQAQDAAAGRQYYVMHPRVKAFAEAQLAAQLERGNP
jgi:methionyl-tRNA formyltransferase